MEKKDLVLISLAAAEGGSYSPVQIQKLLFLIDKKLSRFTGGPHFNFIPYDYGPFDVDVYSVLESLSKDGDVEILRDPSRRLRWYKLTCQGEDKARRKFSAIDPNVAQTIKQLSTFVMSLSFAELVCPDTYSQVQSP